jgi:hypothetical protein
MSSDRLQYILGGEKKNYSEHYNEPSKAYQQNKIEKKQQAKD